MITALFRGYVSQNGLDLYSGTLIRLPMPQYIVFYNGTRDIGERMELKLSESFSDDVDGVVCSGVNHNSDPALECVVTYLNINYGHNQEIMSRCRKLYEYSYLVEQIRRRIRDGKTIETAVDEAVQQSIREGILADFLRRHRAEVRDVILAEYDEDLHIRNEKQISRREGKQEGREEGALQEKMRFVRTLLQDGFLPCDKIAFAAQIPLEKVLELKVKQE